MWGDIARGALGALVIVDARRLDDCYPAVDYFERFELPFVVAVNRFDGESVHDLEAVRWALDVDPVTPVVEFDAREKLSVRDVLLTVLRLALDHAQSSDRAARRAATSVARRARSRAARPFRRTAQDEPPTQPRPGPLGHHAVRDPRRSAGAVVAQLGRRPGGAGPLHVTGLLTRELLSDAYRGLVDFAEQPGRSPRSRLSSAAVWRPRFGWSVISVRAGTSPCTCRILGCRRCGYVGGGYRGACCAYVGCGSEWARTSVRRECVSEREQGGLAVAELIGSSVTAVGRHRQSCR